MKTHLFASVFSMLLPGAVAVAGPIEDLGAGQWLEVDGSYLYEVAPCNDGTNQGSSPSCDAAKGDIRSEFWPSIQGVLGVRAVMQSWGGGTVDTLRNRLIVWGGGHRDYGGNEIYAFELDKVGSGENPWTRLTDPTPYPNTCQEATQCQVQLNVGDNIVDRSCLSADADTFEAPISRHTYGGMAYMPSVDRMFALGGAKHCDAGGCGASQMWTFSFSEGRWHKMDPAGNRAASNCEDSAVYDPIADKVYYHTTKWQEFSVDSQNDTYTIDRTTDFGHAPSPYRTLLMLPSRRLVLQVGRQSVHYLDLTEASPTFKVLKTDGNMTVQNDSNPGLAFDTATGLVIGWVGSSTVYSLDIPEDLSQTATWVSHVGGGDTPPSIDDVNAVDGGMYGRFQYVPNMNVFVAATRTDRNVFIYRHTLDGQSNVQPPSKPSGVSVEVEN